jgi:hypothetical protein
MARITFREWLREEEIKDSNNIFYEELKLVEKEIEKIQIHNENLINFDMFICEAVIEPEKIKISTLDEDKLNKQFQKLKIIFHFGNYKLNGRYDKKSDIIDIFYSNTDKLEEIEAMIGHEMVHKIQHKHSNKYFEQSERIVDQINSNEKKLILLFNTNTKESMREWNILRQKNLKIYNDYLYNTVYEKMAYAYQEVKMNTSGKIKDIINKLERMGFVVDNKLKKYIGMYWLIKDKI